VTDAALAIRSGPVLAVEYDRRLVDQLIARYKDDARVAVHAADLLAEPVPEQPFVVAANPPFNTSTKLLRRWMLSPNFRSGALIVETSFARRVSGAFGTTKLSLSLAPFLELEIGAVVRSVEFVPAPGVPTAILTSARRATPNVSDHDAPSYWAFVNFLFERGSRTVGEALSPLVRAGLPASVGSVPVRDLDVETTIDLFTTYVRGNPRSVRQIRTFEQRLPVGRRSTVISGATYSTGATPSC